MQNAGEARPTARTFQLLVLGVGIVTISALHYLTDPRYAIWHGVYQRLYYAPIIIAAYWYGVRGGVLAALVTSLAYIPHIYTVWAGNPAYARSQYVEVAMFFVAGLLVGSLAERQQRLTLRYRRAAESLETALGNLRESQAHLRRAERLSVLGEVAAGLAHEIRTPLAGVKGALEIISSRAAAGTPEAEFADLGARELNRLDRLVNDFLAYARPRRPDLRDATLGELIEHGAALLHPKAASRGIVLEIERPAPNRAVRVDPGQMQEVLMNVFSNAIEASHPGGRVRVRETTDPAWNVIEVIDEGSGIDAEHLPRIFEPFFTTKEKGTGLGLAISSRIVSAHGGEIDARPNAGCGTIMRIRLPLAGAPQESACEGAGDSV